MEQAEYNIKKLIIDLAIKSYQILLGVMVIAPFVSGKHDINILSFGLILSFTCVIIAYVYTKRIEEEKK